MSFVMAAMKYGAAGGKFLGKTAIGGTAGRFALGAAMGAAYGALTNDKDKTEMAMGGIARSALLGGLMGASTRLFTPAIKFGASGVRSSGLPLGIKAMWGAKGDMARGALGASKMAWGAANFAMNHPVATLGMAGAGYIAFQDNKTPYDSRLAGNVVNQPSGAINFDITGNAVRREDSMLDQMNSGIAPTGQLSGATSISRQRLMSSTMGLVQGLNRGRHG